MSGSRREASSAELSAFRFTLALWLLGLAGEAVSFVREWRALDTGDVSALSGLLPTTADLVMLAAWLIALALAVRLRRWGWLVACLLLIVAVPVFAIVVLLTGRRSAAEPRQQASFEAAMATELAEQDADRSPGAT